MFLTWAAGVAVPGGRWVLHARGQAGSRAHSRLLANDASSRSLLLCPSFLPAPTHAAGPHPCATSLSLRFLPVTVWEC